MAQYDIQRKAIEQKNSSNSSARTVQLRHNNVASIIQMAKMNPEMLTQNDVMVLQKTMGNSAVSQLIKGTGEEQNETIQKKDGKLGDEKPLQMKKENNTGLPDNLKAGVENLSGIDMSDVRVHYNSDKPAGVGALAYTQGTDIHVAPGQERHLPHEVWHVVQQAQGRVQATTQMKGISVNDDVGLEKEADEMGERVSVENTEFQSISSIRAKQNETIQKADCNFQIKEPVLMKSENKIELPDVVKPFVNATIQFYRINHVDYDSEEARSAWRCREQENNYSAEPNVGSLDVGEYHNARISSGHDYHSEKLLIGQALYEKDIPEVEIENQFNEFHNYYPEKATLYTERHPCGRCVDILNQALNNQDEVNWSVRSKEELEEKIQDMRFNREEEILRELGPEYDPEYDSEVGTEYNPEEDQSYLDYRANFTDEQWEEMEIQRGEENDRMNVRFS